MCFGISAFLIVRQSTILTHRLIFKTRMTPLHSFSPVALASPQWPHSSCITASLMVIWFAILKLPEWPFWFLENCLLDFVSLWSFHPRSLELNRTITVMCWSFEKPMALNHLKMVEHQHSRMYPKSCKHQPRKGAFCFSWHPLFTEASYSWFERPPIPCNPL